MNRIILWIHLAVLLFSTGIAQAAELEVTKSANVVTVTSGTTFQYALNYRCVSIIEDCTGVILTDVLPIELSNSALLSTTAHIASRNYNTGTRTATWTFIDPLPAGSTGQVTMDVSFPAGTTPNNTVASNSATITGTNAPTATSNTVLVTATATENWTVVKSMLSGAGLDENVTYRITIESEVAEGHLDLNGAVVTDTLPPGAVFVSATNGGTESGGVVTWNLGTITAGSSGLTRPRTYIRLDVTVQYPSGTFNVGDPITNNVALDGTPPGEIAIQRLAQFNHNLEGPNPGIAFNKSRKPSPAGVGATVTFRFEFTNNGNATYDSLEIIDILDTHLDVTQIRSGIQDGTTTPVAGVNVVIEYQTDQNASWSAVPGSPFNTLTNTLVDVSTLGLPIGDFINQLRYTYATVPVGFAMTNNNNSAGFRATLLDPGHDGSPIGATVDNRATYTAVVTGAADLTGGNNGNVTVAAADEPSPRIEKSVSSGSPADPGDTVRFQLRLRNRSTATAVLSNPVFGDLLDSNLEYVPGSWFVRIGSGSDNTAPDAIFEELTNYDGTGRTLLRWSLTGASAHDLALNESYFVRFDVTVKEGTLAGGVENIGNLIAMDDPSFATGYCRNLFADVNDLDGDGNRTEELCSDTDSSLTINSFAAMESLKLVKGQLDTVFHKFPDSGLTVPGGGLEYKLTVTNVGNVSMDNIVVTDILPFVGDTGVIDPQARLSEWRPQLIAPVTAPAGVIVEYSIESNPCRDNLGDPDPFPAGCDAPNWSVTAPIDITTVQSLRFNFGAIVVNPLDVQELTWPMQAPIGAPDAGEIAWNSFGFVASRVDTGSSLLPAEPIKVGIALSPILPANYGDYVWLDENENGIQDEAVDKGINGVRVEFYHDNGDGIADVATDEFIGFRLTADDTNGDPGYYQFTNKPAGDYFARFIIPAGFAVTGQNLGGDDELDSDADPATGLVIVTTLDPGEEDYSWDLGLFPATTASVGDYVWFDRNLDGIQNEAVNDGINGVTVELYNAADVLQQTTATANHPVSGNPGYYRFDGLDPATTYYIKFTAPSGATFTISTPGGGSDANDSDADQTTGKTDNFTLVAGQFDPTWDAGIILPTGALSLGDRVWLDTNNNGIYDRFTGEADGINGVRLNLYRDIDASGDLSAGDVFYGSTTTFSSFGDSGFYEFTDLPAGDFIVQVDPINFNNGQPLDGLLTSTGNEPIPDPDDDVDHDDNGENVAGNGVASAAITLSEGDEPADNGQGVGNHNPTVDFGFNSGLAVGNRLWFDSDGNGLDDSEPPVVGATVELIDGGDRTTVLATTTTDAEGHYIFSGLTAGHYLVRVVATNFQSGGVLEGYDSTLTVESLPNYNGDLNDNGLSANASADGIRSGIVTLSAGDEPLGEPAGSLGSGGVTDADANLTVDFGFVIVTVSCSLICDVTTNGMDDIPNGVITRNDLRWIFRHKGNIVNPAGTANSGDCNADGVLSINDVRACQAY